LAWVDFVLDSCFDSCWPYLRYDDDQVAAVMKSAPSVQSPVTLTPDLGLLQLGFRLNFDAPRFSMPTMVINLNCLQKDLNL